MSLDHLAADTFSGELQVTIQTATALIFGEQTKQSSGPSTIGIQRDPVTNAPFISSTMIKGMIANAYEKITASRFRIFGSYSSPLTYRADPATAANLVPIRLSDQFSRGDKKATLLHGHNGSKYAHVITHEDIQGTKKKRALLKNSEAWEILQHGTLIYFKAKQIGDAYYVTQVKKTNNSNRTHRLVLCNANRYTTQKRNSCKHRQEVGIHFLCRRRERHADYNRRLPCRRLRTDYQVILI